MAIYIYAGDLHFVAAFRNNVGNSSLSLEICLFGLLFAFIIYNLSRRYKRVPFFIFCKILKNQFIKIFLY